MSHSRTYAPATVATDLEGTCTVVRVTCSCGDASVGTGSTAAAAKADAARMIQLACGPRRTVEARIADALRSKVGR